jgi:hypothetical protein
MSQHVRDCLECLGDGLVNRSGLNQLLQRPSLPRNIVGHYCSLVGVQSGSVAIGGQRPRRVGHDRLHLEEFARRPTEFWASDEIVG